MKRIIVGNWKMNPSTLSEAKSIFSSLKKLSKKFSKTDLIICPPFVYLTINSNNKSNSTIKIGAQDIFVNNPKTGSNPFTGEVSADMLSNLGIKYVILGHSERRALGESSELVNRKIKTALLAGLKTVVCVGEKERDNEGKFFEILRLQIKDTFQKLKRTDLKNIIVAYEPVWAIGKSEKDYMKGDEIYQMTIFIRKILAEIFGNKEVFNIPIIYGGSVSAYNVYDVVKNGQVQGILPGRASLNPKEMKKILEIVS